MSRFQEREALKKELLDVCATAFLVVAKAGGGPNELQRATLPVLLYHVLTGLRLRGEIEEAIVDAESRLPTRAKLRKRLEKYDRDVEIEAIILYAALQAARHAVRDAESGKAGDAYRALAKGLTESDET